MNLLDTEEKNGHTSLRESLENCNISDTLFLFLILCAPASSLSFTVVTPKEA